LAGGGIAAQNLVRDIESGYFDKLLLTPINRGALLLSAILAGAVILGIQAAIVIAVGLVMGLNPATGIGGILVVLALSVLVGVSIAGFTIAIALRTGNAAATQGASFIFFPLTFLTASFVPLDLLSGWLKTAAILNPITYVLEAMRELMITGWDTTKLLEGTAMSLAMGSVMYTFALISLRGRTARK
jgi:ABC-2 type transport system permease protein